MNHAHPFAARRATRRWALAWPLAWPLALLSCGAPSARCVDDACALIDAALVGAHRADSNRMRDAYRHPKETLLFFGFEPDMTVVEIWPGRGWYTEVLAPPLRDRGTLYAADFALTENTPDWRREMAGNYRARLRALEPIYGKVQVTELARDRSAMAPPASADLVLTFRNVHNWVKGGYAPAVFAAMYAALKPCGVLGVVEHRAQPGASLDYMNESGYVTEAHVRALAEAAGLVWRASSEINANPNDNKDHPAGVWSLPPTLRLGEQDRARYLAIGESDRMTVKFQRPQPTRCPADAG